jgi:hypothetical protein
MSLGVSGAESCSSRVSSSRGSARAVDHVRPNWLPETTGSTHEPTTDVGKRTHLPTSMIKNALRRLGDAVDAYLIIEVGVGGGIRAKSDARRVG